MHLVFVRFSISPYELLAYRLNGNKPMSHRYVKRTLWNRLKIIGLFPCYVFKAKSWDAVSVLNFTIMLNNTSGLSSMAFCEIAPASHSCYLFLIQLVITWTKIFKQMLSTWTLPAFDSVNHSVLLQKLKRYGVEGDTLSWFTDYLSWRSQRVILDGVASQWVPVTSGVPQGSLLGSFLFFVSINDLPGVLPEGTQSALYDDDTRVFSSISSIADCERQQQTLKNLNSWSHDNNIRFNASKCKVPTITRKKKPLLQDLF